MPSFLSHYARNSPPLRIIKYPHILQQNIFWYSTHRFYLAAQVNYKINHHSQILMYFICMFFSPSPSVPSSVPTKVSYAYSLLQTIHVSKCHKLLPELSPVLCSFNVLKSLTAPSNPTSEQIGISKLGWSGHVMVNL